MIGPVNERVRSKSTVVTGLAILFLATFGMVVGGFAAFNQDSSDPRKAPDRVCPTC